MTAADIVKLGLIASIMLIVFALGTRSTLEDALWLVRRPARLLRSMIPIYAVVPAAAILLCASFNIDPAVKVAIIALSVSPLPPLLPGKQEGAGAEHQYALSLLVSAAVLSLVLTPLLLSLAARSFGIQAGIGADAIARTLGMTLAAPLLVGIAVRHWAPAAAGRLGGIAGTLGKAMLALGALALIAASWRTMLDLLGNGTVLAIIAIVLVGLAAGHLLAGGTKADRSALALAASSRHPGIAIAIASTNFVHLGKSPVAAVALFLVVNAVVTLAYLKWVGKGAKAS